jgi:hypothetical protein
MRSISAQTLVRAPVCTVAEVDDNVKAQRAKRRGRWRLTADYFRDKIIGGSEPRLALPLRSEAENPCPASQKQEYIPGTAQASLQ